MARYGNYGQDMAKAGSNSGKAGEIEGVKGKKGKRKRKATQTRNLTQSPVVHARQYLLIRKAK